MAHSSLHHELLAQAQHLTDLIRPDSFGNSFGAPLQVDLRRALSSAYYAIFHLLSFASTELMLGDRVAQPIKEQMRRAFTHGDMASVCKFFQGLDQSHQKALTTTKKQEQKQKSPTKPYDRLLTLPIEDDLAKVAGAFVKLQGLRNSADYNLVDMSEGLNSVSAKESVFVVEEAFELWERIRETNNAHVFLTALILHKQWNKE